MKLIVKTYFLSLLLFSVFFLLILASKFYYQFHVLDGSAFPLVAVSLLLSFIAMGPFFYLTVYRDWKSQNPEGTVEQFFSVMNGKTPKEAEITNAIE